MGYFSINWGPSLFFAPNFAAIFYLHRNDFA